MDKGSSIFADLVGPVHISCTDKHRMVYFCVNEAEGVQVITGTTKVEEASVFTLKTKAMADSTFTTIRDWKKESQREGTW